MFKNIKALGDGLSDIKPTNYSVALNASGETVDVICPKTLVVNCK